MPQDAGVVDPAAPVFGLSASQIGRRIDAAAKAAGLGEGFTGHSGRVGRYYQGGGVRRCQSGMRWPAFPKPW